jgi:superfamily II DNA or RNA helicase
VIEEVDGEMSVIELDAKIMNEEGWQALSKFNVTISTPNCVSPGIDDIPIPPEDLFDLVLIDEAHHSAAKTWVAILESFPQARKILFTATPFRRDRKEIKAPIIYSYPLSKAYADGTFGKIKFEPVKTVDATDLHIALKAEDVLKVDKKRKLNHALMVRTNSKSKAKELEKIYSENTSLKLKRVDSSLAYTTIKETLKELRQGKLDGIICVDMLGEGFDFPNLKIAALHAPHKSLEVTLQFIGRFSRTADGVDEAKFIAIPNEIELDAEQLYKEGKIWQEVIMNLSENRIEKEIKNRQTIEGFRNIFISDEAIKELSLFALKPSYHVKILRNLGEFNIHTDVDFPSEQFRILRRDISEDSSAVIFITGEKSRPRWAATEDFDTIDYDLFIVYYDEPSELLFINSTNRNVTIYDQIARQFTGARPKTLATSRINKVLLELTETKFFNVGMKNTVTSNLDESYRIISGSQAQKSIKKSDSQSYGRGHLFAKAMAGEKRVTIGLSSASKVWSQGLSSIPVFLEWCAELANKINSDRTPITGTELDYLKLPTEVNSIPDKTPIAVSWNERIYKSSFVLYEINEDGELIKHDLLDATFHIDHATSNSELIRFAISVGDSSVMFDFSLNDSAEYYFTPVTESKLLVGKNDDNLEDISVFINANQLLFYFNDFSLLDLHNYHTAPDSDAINFDVNQIEAIDWTSVDVASEFENPKAGLLSIHEYINQIYIPTQGYTFVYYDHGKGEVADFITLTETTDTIKIQLIHVKATRGADPAARVGDAYEVTSQVIRSVRSLNVDALSDHIEHRQGLDNKYGHRRDDVSIFRKIIDSSTTKKIQFENVLVQPGISKVACTSDNNITNNLAAAADFCKQQNCAMIVLGSS